MSPSADARYVDLLRQGIWKTPSRTTKRVVDQTIVACERCHDWHRVGKHIAQRRTA